MSDGPISGKKVRIIEIRQDLVNSSHGLTELYLMKTWVLISINTAIKDNALNQRNAQNIQRT